MHTHSVAISCDLVPVYLIIFKTVTTTAKFVQLVLETFFTLINTHFFVCILYSGSN